VVLYDSIETLKDRMVADFDEHDGVKIGEGKVRYVADGVHDYLAFTAVARAGENRYL